MQSTYLKFTVGALWVLAFVIAALGVTSMSTFILLAALAVTIPVMVLHFGKDLSKTLTQRTQDVLR